MTKNLFSYVKITIVITVISIVTVLLYNNSITKTETNNDSYELVVLNSDSTWVYKIFYENTLLIKQEYIPAVGGNQRFVSEEDAKRVGELMIKKLKNHKTPSITIKDLKINDISFKI